jgi:hypothetical protein
VLDNDERLNDEFVEKKNYTLEQLPLIMGILQGIIDEN